MTMTRILVLLALLFPVVAAADDLVVTGTMVGQPPAPDSHAVSATLPNGDTHTIHDAKAITVDGQPVAPLLDQLADLRAKHAELKDAKDKDARTLLWAALIAGVLKALLSLVNRIWSKPKKWTAWGALGLSVPIALLSHFAAGNGWFDSLLFAGAGPGAIAIHELLKLFGKKQEPAVA
jgi:hypothetical protein